MLGQVPAELFLPFPGFDVALGHPLVQEGLFQLGVQCQHIGHQILQVDDLCSVIPQNLSEGIMLLLGDLQEGNIVEQQLRKTIRNQIQQLPAGAVQKYLLKHFDLASNANTFHRFLQILFHFSRRGGGFTGSGWGRQPGRSPPTVNPVLCALGSAPAR